jgi:soluble lytic murein transglycosylase-like protein
MLAASPMRAAEPSRVSSLLASEASQGKVSMVRVDRRTGKLVRIIDGAYASTPPHLAAPPESIDRMVENSARAHGVDPLLIHSVIQVESGYNTYAVSRKGAEGLMQLMPGTSRSLGVGNSFDPAQNIEAGVRYLKQLQELYKDDRLALAAYNAGPGAVDRYRRVPPYAETQSYIEQVGRRYRAASKAREEKQAAQAQKTVAAPERRPKLQQFVDQDGRLYLKTVFE